MSNLALCEFLPKLSEAISAITGLSFPENRWSDLTRALGKAASDAGFEEVSVFCDWLLDPVFLVSRIESFAKYLTIGETHFFRDEKLFQALEHRILPELFENAIFNGRGLKFWSAGCSTGEEAYSLAILLNKLYDAASRDYPVLASDINRDALEKAVAGTYTQWSFRQVPQSIRESYFRDTPEGIEVLEEARKSVRFFYLNLAKDLYPDQSTDTHNVDLIFCRNVLMYFTEEWQNRVLENLSACLTENGYLVVSPAEASMIETPALVPVNVPGTVLFKKANGRPFVRRRSFYVPKRALHFPCSTELLPGFPDLRLSFPFLEETEEAPVDACAVADPNSSASDSPTQPEVTAPATDRPFASESDAPEDCAPAPTIAQIKSSADQGRLEEALAWAEQGLEANKLSAEYHYVHGSILQERGDLDEAINSMNKAVFLNPGFVVAHFALGNLELMRGNRKISERHYSNALQILRSYPDDACVPGADGMTAGDLKDIVTALSRKEWMHATT